MNIFSNCKATVKQLIYFHYSTAVEKEGDHTVEHPNTNSRWHDSTTLKD